MRPVSGSAVAIDEPMNSYGILYSALFNTAWQASGSMSWWRPCHRLICVASRGQRRNAMDSFSEPCGLRNALSTPRDVWRYGEGLGELASGWAASSRCGNKTGNPGRRRSLPVSAEASRNFSSDRIYSRQVRLSSKA